MEVLVGRRLPASSEPQNWLRNFQTSAGPQVFLS